MHQLQLLIARLCLQSGATAVHTPDDNGHAGQRGLLAGQWAHHGAVAGPQHPPTFPETGQPLAAMHTLLLALWSFCCQFHLQYCADDCILCVTDWEQMGLGFGILGFRSAFCRAQMSGHKTGSSPSSNR